MGNTRLTQHLLYLKKKIYDRPTLPPPKNYAINIHMPKGRSKKNILHDTTWKNAGFDNWIQNTTGGLDVPIPTDTNQTPPVTFEPPDI